MKGREAKPKKRCPGGERTLRSRFFKLEEDPREGFKCRKKDRQGKWSKEEEGKDRAQIGVARTSLRTGQIISGIQRSELRDFGREGAGWKKIVFAERADGVRKSSLAEKNT